MNEPSSANEVVTAGIAAISAASKTPFRTAFKISLGIALASITTMVICILSAAFVFYLLYELIKNL